MFSSFLENLRSLAASIPFDGLVWLVWGTFAGIFVLTLVLSLLLPKVRVASKTPFLCLVNAYTGVTLAVFLLHEELSGALFVAAAFWVVGYLLYGALKFFCRDRAMPAPPAPAQVAISSSPAARTAPPPVPLSANPSLKPQKVAEAPVARLNVRLEHAITVTDRLLEKDLGKTDRQELEKLKNTLAVLRVKGTLTPAEGEILNENFNTLLKLMAKYNV